LLKRMVCAGLLLISMGSKACGQTAPHESAEWKQLFNGKDLTGWRHVGPGSMLVEDGLIETHTRKKCGLLYWTGGKLDNCVIRVVYRLSNDYAGSGIYVEIPIEPNEAEMPVHYGYEVQIDNHPDPGGEYGETGALYGMTKTLAKAWKPGAEWNAMEITLDGPRTIVLLNGVKVTDYTEGDPTPRDDDGRHFARPNEGWFGLQNHQDDHGQGDAVFFKEIAVKPLR
jgi:3-keto-disaccharide hydrolase